MDKTVDNLSRAYQEFITAAAAVIEANDISGAEKSTTTGASLENFKQRRDVFLAACDEVEKFVESVKQKVGVDCLVDLNRKSEEINRVVRLFEIESHRTFSKNAPQ